MQSHGWKSTCLLLIHLNIQIPIEFISWRTQTAGTEMLPQFLFTSHCISVVADHWIQYSRCCWYQGFPFFAFSLIWKLAQDINMQGISSVTGVSTEYSQQQRNARTPYMMVEVNEVFHSERSSLRLGACQNGFKGVHRMHMGCLGFRFSCNTAGHFSCDHILYLQPKS